MLSRNEVGRNHGNARATLRFWRRAPIFELSFTQWQYNFLELFIYYFGLLFILEKCLYFGTDQNH